MKLTNPPSDLKSKIEITSIHEASHALMAMHEKRIVQKISISKSFPGDGYCSFTRGVKNPYHVENEKSSAQLAWNYTYLTTISDIRIALAGSIAEAHLMHRSIHYDSAYWDLESCTQSAERLMALRDYISQFIETQTISPISFIKNQFEYTKQWVTQNYNWRLINYIAEVLCIHGNIDEKTLRLHISKVSKHEPQCQLPLI